MQSARKMGESWRPKISGTALYEAFAFEFTADWCSVVFEWLKRKQKQGVERGWKDGGPKA